MMDRYILKDKTPVACEDLLMWGRWLETCDRHVGNDTVDGVQVSTVFLGLDHRFTNGGEPILFETMVFGGAHDQWQNRYCTWEQAEKGHAAVLAAIREGRSPDETLAA